MVFADVGGAVAAFYRLFIGTSVLLPFLLLKPQRQALPALRADRVALGLVIASGLIFALQNFSFYAGVRHTAPETATFLANTAVIWVGLVTAIGLRHRPPLLFWLGAALGMLGIYLLTVQGSAQGLSLGRGELLALLTSFLYTAYLLVNRIARQRVPALVFAAVAGCASFALLLLVVLLLDAPLTGYSAKTYLALLAIGLISQALGMSLILYAQKFVPAAQASTILLLQPVVTLVLAIALLGSVPTSMHLLGMFAVLTGVLLANRNRFEDLD